MFFWHRNVIKATMQEDRIRMNVTAFLYYGTIAFEEHGAALFNLHEQTAVAAAQKKKT